MIQFLSEGLCSGGALVDRRIKSGYYGDFFVTTTNILNLTPLYVVYPPGIKSEALRLEVHLILFYFPPASESETLRLRVHLILFYFIGCHSPPRRFLFYLVGGGMWATFWFFKSLDNNMVYS